MAIQFDIEIDGLFEVLDTLDGAAGAMRDPRPALRRFGEDLLVANESRLSRGLDVDGAAMTPSKRAERDGGQTMVEEGNLLGSLNYDAERTGLDLFSSDIRAAVHWDGKTIKAKNASGYLTIVFTDENGDLQYRKVREVKMPERKWFGISESDLEMAEEQLARDILGGGRE